MARVSDFILLLELSGDAVHLEQEGGAGGRWRVTERPGNGVVRAIRAAGGGAAVVPRGGSERTVQWRGDGEDHRVPRDRGRRPRGTNDSVPSLYRGVTLQRSPYLCIRPQVRGLSLLRARVGVAGSTAVGAVAAVGAGVAGVTTADKVLVVSPHGVWTDNVTVPR